MAERSAAAASIRSAALSSRSALGLLPNPLREPRQPETHDVILRASRLPALGEKVSTTQSQHRSISEVNCIYSHTAVED